MSNEKILSRWRLVLGKYAEKQLSCSMSAQDLRRECALDYLYNREYRGRGVREQGKKGPGSLDPSQLTVPGWLNEVRELFPKETIEVIEKHALDRYGMTELITDPEVLEKLEPNWELLKTILTFRRGMNEKVLGVARRIIREVVEEIKRKLEQEVRRSLWGRRNRFQRSPIKVAQNLDWRSTIHKNLKYYDRERKRLIVRDVRFFSRIERQLPWDLILCVDQSGSMAGSVIHSAIMAGILTQLQSLRVSLVVFDTSVVDLSDRVDDPIEILLSVQLGGGTDIGQALSYCGQLIRNPHRTILVLISDFCEGAPVERLLSASRQLKEAGVKLLGLASLDEVANPAYDIQMAERLAVTGMEIAALTPKRFAEWLAKVIS
jgi:Mg-chelatase subunit ChlD